MEPTQNQTQAPIPLPPGYTQDEIIDNPANPASSAIPPPPPPGYSASQVIDNPGYTTSNAPPAKPQSVTTMTPEQDNPYLDINPGDSLGMKVLKGTNAVGAGLGEGLLGTINGGASLLHLPHATLQAREDELKQENAQNPYLRGTGLGAESLAEFLSGDEILKGLTAGQKYIKVGKLLEQIEGSPVMTRIVNAGVRALRGGVVGTIQGGVKSGGDPSEAIASGVGAATGNALVPEAFDLVKAAPGAIKGGYTAISEALRGAEKVVQPELQQGLKKVLSDVAAEHGVAIPDGTAVRDMAQTVSDGIRRNAKAIYSKIDDALGGTDLKSINNQLEQAQKALNQDSGFDHDATGRLIEHLNHLEDYKAQLRQTALDAGVPPEAFSQADNLWRQASAMQDLSAKIRQSTIGLPENLQDGSTAAGQAKGEEISPSKLTPKIHMLRDSGRLSQALTQDLSAARGNDLLRTVEAARARSGDIASARQIVGKVGTGLAYAAGAGGVGAGIVHHLTQ